MESSRILVTGLPEGTTETDLRVYFQSIRNSGGDDVKEIDIDGKQAVVTFKEAQAASRIVFGKRKHSLKSYPLIVSLLPEASDSSNTEDEEEDTLEMDDQLDEYEYGTANNSPKHHLSSRYNRHEGAEVSTELVRMTSINQTDLRPPLQCTVKVTGLSTDTSEDLLTNYFENTRRSKGGPISSVDMDRDLLECFITFELPDDAMRTVESSPHKVGGLSLDVSLLEEEDDAALDTGDEECVKEENITIIVSGTLPSEDALWNYFENERRSGGGEVLQIDYTDEGDAIITFAEVKDLKRLLEDPHSIDKKRITVVRRLPDPRKVHVQGLNETTSEDCLRYYLEKFCAAEVSEVYKGCNNNALAVFDADPDFQALFDKVSKDPKGLEGRHLRLERVPLCSCIQVNGLKKETSEDTIELYFENNRKSGGSCVICVERIENDEVLVYFEDPSSVQSVVKRRHVLEGQKLDVKPHYPFLESSATKQTEIALDADVYNYIKMNHQHDLQAVLDEQKVIVKPLEDPQSSTITVLPSEKKNDSLQLWQERVGGLESFLRRFTKTEIQIGAELFNEITRRWHKEKELNSAQGSCNHLVSFNAHGQCAQIIGEEGNVNEEDLRLRGLIDAAQKDTELIHSIVEADVTDIPKPRLAFLKISGVGEKLQNEHRHLTIAFDLEGNRLLLKAPSNVLQEVKLEIYKLSSKVIERTLELSTNVTAVLKKSAVSEFLQNLLKKNEIQALLVYDENKSKNEVKVVGYSPKSVTDAEMVMQSSIQERSLHLTHEKMLMLEGRQWKECQSKLISTFNIGLYVEYSSSTLWVSGIAEDVNTCFERVKQFLDVNTILHDTVPMDQWTTRFIFEKWGTKLESIKKDLAACCIDLRAASDFEGIEVSGTTEGLEKCLPRLRELSNAVQKPAVSDFTPTLVKENKSKGLTVFDADPVPQTTTVSSSSQERVDVGSSLHGEDENQKYNVNPNRPATTSVNETIHSPERNKDDTHADRKASSTSLEIQNFEIEPRIVNIFVKVHGKELEEIETNYHVEIPRKAERNNLCMKPKVQCSADDYAEACSTFISLYQKMQQLIKMERFSLKSETKIILARVAISKISRKFPILVEMCKDRSGWELYGVASHIEQALKYLEEEGVGINRENENAVDVKERRKQKAMNVDPTEYSRETCPICLDPISSPRSLKCKHVFCSGCLQTALDVCNKCPVCQEPQVVLKGNQPRGEMRSHTEHYNVPGHEAFGSLPSSNVKGITMPPQSLADNHCGTMRGLQGHHNSCYLDATLYSMFAFSYVFDTLLHRQRKEGDLPEYDAVQLVLRESIVNPLRVYGFVRADHILQLRELLDKLSSTAGLVHEKKDPEEFLNSLLQQVLKADPFFHLKSRDVRERDSEGAFFYQIITEKDEALKVPQVQQLLEQSLLSADIILTEVPSCLILQMPRFGSRYKMYDMILPDLELDVTHIVENEPRECTMCGSELAQFECKMCHEKGLFGDGPGIASYCLGCNAKVHSSRDRVDHKTRPFLLPRQYIRERMLLNKQKMDLFAVVCIHTSHYVTFVKCGVGVDAPWCFFDSMAERKGEKNAYNIPAVTRCPEALEWLCKEPKEIIAAKERGDIPEKVRRLLGDGYLCMYQNLDMAMFK